MGEEQGTYNYTLQPAGGGSGAGGEHFQTLLAPSAYFARYGDNLSRCETPYWAWLETEKEFNREFSASGPVVFRRFISYTAFRNALRKYLAGEMPTYLKIHILLVA